MKLTTRQWTTYNFIKEASIRGEKVTIEEIIANYPESLHADGYGLSSATTHDKCTAVWNDITKINASSEVEKIILIDNFTYKIATEEEALAYYEGFREKAIRALMKAKAIKDKMRANGQGKLVSCQDTAIDDNSNARHFVETYLGD